MKKFERLITTHDDSMEQHERTTRERIRLDELIARKDIESDKTMVDTLKLILKQNGYLSHIEVVFISPEEEPDTGGSFHRMQVDEQSFIPTIFIVSENQAHMQRLKDTRQSSVKRVAEMLGIDFSKLTPSLLRRFIIAHEIGHAADYVKNYETNPDYQGTDAAEEWDLHYEANLLNMPVPGFDPVDLREEVSKFNDIEAFLEAHPDVKKL